MIHKVKLKVRDEERWLTSVSYGYHIKFSDAPDIDKIIQLYQEVALQLGSEQVLPIEGGFLRLRFLSTDHDQFFYDWLFTCMMEDGGIEFLQNEVEAVSRISFWDCYCVGVEEWMSADGAPMGIELLLSPAILKKDALVHEKVWKITDIHGNTEEVKAVEKEAPKPTTPPTYLITAVTGKASALPNAVVEYKVTDYNLPNVSSSDKARIKWMVKMEDKEFSQKAQGEILKLTIDEAWAGKDIVVMPYLEKYTPKVSVKTLIKKQIIVFFIGGAGDKKTFLGSGPYGNILTPMNDLTSLMRNINYVDYKCVYLGFYELYPPNLAYKEIAKNIKTKNISIYIVGHSFGGWNGAHLSRLLVTKGYRVKMLITLDPVRGRESIRKITELYPGVPPRVYADFWINIYASLKISETSDVVARVGKRWEPWKEKHAPHINMMSYISHANAGGMFKEVIPGTGKSACDYLIESIKNKDE